LPNDARLITSANSLRACAVDILVMMATSICTNRTLWT
jgi:hypothetical protein